MWPINNKQWIHIIAYPNVIGMPIGWFQVFLVHNASKVNRLKGRLRVHLVDYNDNYIGIGIDITTNERCCNVIIIPIQLFGNPIVIEPWIYIPHVWYNILKRCNESFLNQIA